MIGGKLVAAAALTIAGTASAQMSDYNGAALLGRGDYAGAERLIVAQQRMFPRDADLLLNLAYVYAHTGRTVEARRLYQQVLTQDDDRVDLAARQAVGAHAVAREGLRRLPVAVASIR